MPFVVLARRAIIVAVVIIGCIAFSRQNIAFAQSVTADITVTGTVLDASSNKPIPSATVSIAGPSASTVQSVRDGSFSAAVLQGLYSVTVTADGYQTATQTNVVINEGAAYIDARLVPVAPSSSISPLRVIGSVTVRANPLNTTTASISSISTQRILDSGIPDIRRILDQLPGFQAQAGFTGVAGSPYNPIYLSIRGSQPYETALTIDGHSLPAGPSTGPNLSAFDLNAFTRIDIVKGPGASSSTINDAIGGTVNLVSGMPSGPLRGVFDVGYDGLGTTTFHGGIVGTTTNQRFGFKVDETSANSNFANMGPQPFYGSGLSTEAPVNGENFSCTSTCGPISVPGGAFFNEPLGFFGCCLPADEGHGYKHATSAKLFYDVTPHVTASILYSVINEMDPGTYEQENHTFQPPPGYTGPVAAGTPVVFYSPFGLPSDNISWTLTQLVEYGLDADIGTLHAHASVLTENPKTYGLEYFNYPAGTYVFNGVAALNGTTQIFNGTPVTLGVPVSDWSSSSSIAYIHDWLLELTQPLGAAKLTASFDDTRSSGVESFSQKDVQILPTNTPTLGNSIPRAGLFEDFKTERLTLDTPLAPSLSGTLSMYLNQYYYNAPQFANATLLGVSGQETGFVAPRAAFEWRPQPSIAVRLSAGSALAPVPIESLNGTSTITYNATCSGVGAGPCYTSSANPNGLQPEVSFGEDLGADLDLHHFTTLSADVYHTLLHGQFFTNTTLDGTCSDGIHGTLPCYVSQERNLGQSRYYGLELKLAHAPPLGFTWSVSGDLERSYAYNIPPSFYATLSGPDTTNLAILPEQNFNGNSQFNRIPYSQGYASIGYNSRHLSGTLGATYYGTGNAYFIPAFFVLDAQVIYQFDRRTSLTLTAGNLGNVDSAEIENAGVYGPLTPQLVGASTLTNMVMPVGPPTLAVQLKRLIGP